MFLAQRPTETPLALQIASIWLLCFEGMLLSLMSKVVSPWLFLMPTAPHGEVFIHDRPATARGMVWGHVERRDMVASFDWQPTPAGRYMVPPAVKRWVTG